MHKQTILNPVPRTRRKSHGMIDGIGEFLAGIRTNQSYALFLILSRVSCNMATPTIALFNVNNQ